MADELKVSLGVELDESDFSAIQNKINELKNTKDNKIHFDLNKTINNQIAALQKSLNNLVRKPYKIDIQIGNSIIENLKSISNNLGQTISTAQRTIGNISAQGNYAGQRNNGLPYLGQLTTIETFGSDSYQKIQKFNEELGVTRTLIQDIKKDQETGKEEITRTTEQITENYEKQAAAISKQLELQRKQEQHAKDVASKYDTSYRTRMSEAFDQKNPISGDFRGEVDSVLAEWKGAIDAIGTSITKDQENVLAQLEQRTKNTIKEQRSKQWGATDFASKDITGEVKIQANEVEHQLNKLKGMGELNRLKDMGVVADDIKDKFEELKNSLANVSDQEGLQKWLEQFREAKSELQTVQDQIRNFQNSAQGMAMNLADSIGNDQLKQIEELLSNSKMWEFTDGKFDVGNMEGVSGLINQLQTLKTNYEYIREAFQSGDITDESFATLSNTLKGMDIQLKDVAQQAKIFQDTMSGGQKLEQFNQRAANLRITFEQLKQRYADLIKSNPQIAAKFEEMANSIKNIDPTNVNTTARGLNTLGKEASFAAGETGGLRGALHDAFGGVGDMIARFASAYYIINKISSAIKSMVNEVRAIDTSIVELTKVTTLSGQALDDFVNKAYEVGKGLGRTGKDVIDATTTFSRAGYDLQEATQLAQSALVMSNVGVDIPNMESAASDMISILKAFDLQANESMDIISKLYNVANTQPLDFGNITQMLVTAGGTLAQTNTSIEESMGLLTGAYATLRDTSVANG